MEPAVIASIIGGAATITSGTIGAVVGRASGRKAVTTAVTTIEAQSQRSAKSLEEQLLDRYGLRAASVVSEFKAINDEGDASIARSWQGITVGDEHKIGHITGKHWISGAAGKIASGPSLSVTSPKFTKHVSLIVDRKTDREVDFRVEVAGAIVASDPPLDFRTDITISKAILLDPAAVKAAFGKDLIQHDYHGFDVEFPIDELELRVTLPTALRASIHPMVCWGSSEVTHDAELRRCQSGFLAAGSGAKFVVQKPLVGFRYLLVVELLDT